MSYFINGCLNWCRVIQVQVYLKLVQLKYKYQVQQV